MTNKIKEEIYFISDIEKLIRRNRLTIRRWYEKGNFPRPILLSGNRLAWKVNSVHDWINNQFDKEIIKTPKEAFESLPKELQDHLLYLKAIPGALDRFLKIAQEINNNENK